MDAPQSNSPPRFGTARLKRSSWKAEAIRRGQLKISGPIPWDDDAGDHSTKRHTDPLSESLSQHNSSPPRPQADVDVDGAHQLVHELPATADAEADAPLVQHERSASTMGLQTLADMQRQPPNLIATQNNSPSPLESGAESPTHNNSTAQRKKRRSGLRTVIRKMFGRRSKDGLPPQDQQQTAPAATQREPSPVQQQQQQQQQDQFPPLETTSELPDGGDGNVGRNARVFSVPFQEIQPRGPLGPRLPFPMNVNAPEEASPSHEYLTFEPSGSPKVVHRRRATLPSVVFSSTDAAALSAYWATDDVPVTSQDEQAVRLGSRRTEEPEIGIALSSPSRLKRRSRSAGALQDMARQHHAFQADTVLPVRSPRRRSAEIRYWRNSGMERSISVYSENKTPPKELDEEEKIGTAAASAAAPDSHQLDPEQIQAFNFGNLTGVDPQTSPGADRTPTMTEQSTLSFDDASFADDQNLPALPVQHAHPLASHRVQQPFVLDEVPKGRRTSRERSSSGTSSTHRALSFSYNTPPKAFVPPSPPLQPIILSSASPQDARASDPIMSNNPTSTDAPLPTSKAAEQFAAIYTILRHERAARKALEKQVATLQRELQDLRVLTHKLATPSYPTPSPDTLNPRHSDATQRQHETTIVTGTAKSRFSGFGDSGDEHENEPDDDVSDATGHRSPEVFETPREESVPYGFGFGTVQTARAVTVGEGGKF